MAATGVNLNGTDWSNLFIVDYPGGAGGEMLSAKVAEDTSALHFFNKNQNLHPGADKSVIDSCGNEFSGAVFSKMIQKHYNVSQPAELRDNTLLLQQVMKSSIVMWGFNQSRRPLGFIGPIVSLEANELLSDFMEYFNISVDTDNRNVTDNVVVRLHDETVSTENLTNSRRIRLYPKTEQEAYINSVRMCVVKWLETVHISNIPHVKKDTWPKWLRKSYEQQSKNLFNWQIECLLKEINHLTTFEDFYDDYLYNKLLNADRLMISKYNDSVISSHSWTNRGLNLSEQEQYSDIIGVKYNDTDELANWREKNKSLFSDRLDVNIDSDDRKLIKRKVLKLAHKICTQLK